MTPSRRRKLLREYRAAIFDLDGVLWDGEPLYHEAFNIVLAPLGHHLSDEDYRNIIGYSVEHAWDWVRRRFQLDRSPGRFYHNYNEAVLRLLEQPVATLPGVRELIANFRARGIPVGLASASLRPWVAATLAGIGMKHAFDEIVTASDVARSKPAPDLYLEAARRLKVPPEDCLAFEDTAAGIASAKSAGMHAVQVRAASTALPPLPQADLVIDDFSQFDPGLLSPSDMGAEK